MLAIPDLHNWRKSISLEARNELDKFLTTKKYSSGEYVYSAGETSNYAYQIISGKIKVCNYSKDGNELILSNFHVDDCFGDISLISGLSRINYAVACRDTTLNILKRTDFENIIVKYPEILLSFNKVICNRLQYTMELLEDAVLLPLYQRLAKTLIKLALSRGKTDHQGRVIVKNISQETLGHMVGVTRQSIGRELKKLEDDNLITLKYRQLTFLDLPQMIDEFDYILLNEPLVPLYNTTK